MNEQTFNIDGRAAEKLGLYVYALIDPRDRKVFYIGQGHRNRVNDHFDETRASISNGGEFTSKIRRIQNIWEEGMDVDIVIIRHGLQSQEEANHAEGACISILGLSQNGFTYNLNAGPSSVGHGALLIDDVEMLNAEPVYPTKRIDRVFVFNSNSSSLDGDGLYDAIRGDWIVSATNRAVFPSYAVVLSRGVSSKVYQITEWEESGEKYRFAGHAADQLEETLVDKRWSSVIGATLGYWQYGNYLIVNFDGDGRFQFVRGLRTNDWFPLEAPTP